MLVGTVIKCLYAWWNIEDESLVPPCIVFLILCLLYYRHLYLFVGSCNNDVTLPHLLILSIIGVTFIENKGISVKSHIIDDGTHLNKRGTDVLFMNILDNINDK